MVRWSQYRDMEKSRPGTNRGSRLLGRTVEATPLGRCGLAIQPTPLPLARRSSPERAGLNANLTMTRNGQSALDADVALGREGWFLHPHHASVTIHTRGARYMSCTPSSRWLLPDLILKSDGTSRWSCRSSTPRRRTSRPRSRLPTAAARILGRCSEGGPFGPARDRRRRVHLPPTLGERASVGDQLSVRVQVQGVPSPKPSLAWRRRRPHLSSPGREVPVFALLGHGRSPRRGVVALLTGETTGRR